MARVLEQVASQPLTAPWHEEGEQVVKETDGGKQRDHRQAPPEALLKLTEEERTNPWTQMSTPLWQRVSYQMKR